MGKFKRVFKLEKNILRTLGKARDFGTLQVDHMAENHPHNKAFKALQKVKNIATAGHLLERGEKSVDHIERGVNHLYDYGHKQANKHLHHGHAHHNNQNQDY